MKRSRVPERSPEKRGHAAVPFVAGTLGFVSDEAVVWIAEKLCLPTINILELVTSTDVSTGANRQNPLPRLPHTQLRHGRRLWR